MAVRELTVSHKTVIRKSWGKLDPEKHGMLLKLRTFQRNPNYQDLFDEFQGMKMEELITKRYHEVQDHALPVMKAINFAVKNMNNPAAFKRYFKDLPESKLSSTVPMDIEFSNIQSVIIDCWRESLGTMDSLTEEAWTILMRGIINIMMESTVPESQEEQRSTDNQGDPQQMCHRQTGG